MWGETTSIQGLCPTVHRQPELSLSCPVLYFLHSLFLHCAQRGNTGSKGKQALQCFLVWILECIRNRSFHTQLQCCSGSITISIQQVSHVHGSTAREEGKTEAGKAQTNSLPVLALGAKRHECRGHADDTTNWYYRL